jgi:predicted metal-binding protein
MSQTVLTICLTCGMKQRDATGAKLPNPESESLAAKTAELLSDTPITVQLTRCLSMCDTPIAWGLRNEERHAFSFAPASTAEDLAATARAYLATAPGEKLGKKDMPPAVALSLISRLPPLK